MSFLINCDNKGCFKLSAALLDTSDQQVYCVECNKKITNITQFAKNQLKNLGQIKKNVKPQQSYAVNCSECGKTDTPSLKNNKVVCAHCEAPITKLSKPFEKLIKDKLKSK